MIHTFNYTNLSQEELKLLVSKMPLVPINVIVYYSEYFKMIPLVYQAFINEFTTPYITDLNRRIILHQFCSEIISVNMN